MFGRTFILVDLNNPRKSQEILGNPGKSWEILGNPGKSWEIPGNPGKSWEILENNYVFKGILEKPVEYFFVF